jgi:hypothetical protein
LHQAVIVRRGQVIAFGLLLGLLSAGGLVVGAVALHDLRIERQKAVALAIRTAQLESPSEDEVIEQITSRLRTCLAKGGCRRTIRTTIRRVLRYAEVRRGPRGARGKPGKAGPRGASGLNGQRGANGKAGKNGHNGTNTPGTVEVVQTPAPDPRVELNARLLQDLDELVASLTGRVDRLDALLRCVLKQPLNLLRC